MKINRQLLFSILFSLSILVGALHNLEHAHHSADNCPICTMQSHTDSADITPQFYTNVIQQAYILPQIPQQIFISSSLTPTLFGRAPPNNS